MLLVCGIWIKYFGRYILKTICKAPCCLMKCSCSAKDSIFVFVKLWRCGIWWLEQYNVSVDIQAPDGIVDNSWFLIVWQYAVWKVKILSNDDDCDLRQWCFCFLDQFCYNLSNIKVGHRWPCCCQHCLQAGEHVIMLTMVERMSPCQPVMSSMMMVPVLASSVTSCSPDRQSLLAPSTQSQPTQLVVKSSDWRELSHAIPWDNTDLCHTTRNDI